MSKADPSQSKKARNQHIRWVLTIFFVTVITTALITLISDELMSKSGMITSFAILLIIVFIGIIFDVIGVAVTSADDSPFHSMAARKVPGARESLRLLRRAERVSSICNDVVGDICGVVSGVASATIAAQVLQNFEFSWPRMVSLVMSALVSGLTVGGKAIGKSFAVNSSTKIVHFTGRVIYTINHIGAVFGAKAKNKK